MIDWSKLEHAYGAAEGIPAMLDLLSADPNSEVLERLRVHLWYEDRVYSASFAALPKLAAVARCMAPAQPQRFEILKLAGRMVAREDQLRELGNI